MDRKRKRELRDLNTKVWEGETNVFPVSKSLDSSLKKNTAFIKRLRTAISSTTLSTFLHEIKTLSLNKYLSEIISACYEGLCKLKSPGEVEAGVEIVSALHQRFGPQEFTEYLGWLVGKGLATPDKSLLKTLTADAREKEEKDRISRQRVLLRVVTELWLVGVLRTLDDVSRPDDAARSKETLVGISKGADTKPRSSAKNGGAEPFPLEVLKDLLGHDRDHTNLPLLVIFVKAFSFDILGVKDTTSEGRKIVQEDGATKTEEQARTDTESETDTAPPKSTENDAPLASPELQERFKNILNRYFDDLKGHLIRDQKALASQARRDSEAYVKSGTVFDDRQANYEKRVKTQERLIANAQVLADAIGAEMPELKTAEDSSNTAGKIGLVKTQEYLRGQGEGAGIWEDEDERRFYENLVDLKGKVPGMLLEEVKKKKTDSDEQVGKRKDADAEVKFEEVDEASTAIANKTVGVQVDALLARLSDLTNKELIDQAAIDFCFLNSKASRNRLIKAVCEVPKGRSDLLPNWSRLIATLGKYMPDVTKGLVDHLDSEFRSLQRRKEKDFLGQVRLSNIRYLAELTKFGVVPEHVIFHCLKVSLDDFSRMNIEIICSLLENCGRYLLRNSETQPRMQSFLETLQRKKAAQHIGQQERMLIENAVYYVDPPARAAIPQKERTPMDLFIRKLVYMDMNKKNYTKILRQIRRLHWEEKEVTDILEKIFSKPGKVKYNSIHLLAILISALHRYHQDFVTTVIDNVLEYITLGLEQNDFKYNQKRLSEVKYLGELYNYRMVDHPVIFDTMYKIMTFGHGGVPMPGKINTFDMPDDYFRIRLVAVLLETCGVYFNRGAAGKKLDYFLSFFQYYIYTKDPLPMDIEFIVHDIFSLTRPHWKLASNMDEASKAFQLAVQQDQKTSGAAEKVVEPEEVEIEESSDDGGDNEAAIPEAVDSSDDENDDESGDDEPTRHDSDSEEEQIVVTKQEEEYDPEDEADFEREYAKMMAESLESRKFDRKPLFDVPLPMRRKDREVTTHNENASGDDQAQSTTPAPANTMAFSLLTKRGNRQQTKTVELPSDSTFAIAMKTQQQAEREEQQRIKSLVLNYDLQDADDQESTTSLPPIEPNWNIHKTRAGQLDKQTHSHSRVNKSADNRSGQRSRKLQLSDVDWYESQKKSKPEADASSSSTSAPFAPSTPSVASFAFNFPPLGAAHHEEVAPLGPKSNNRLASFSSVAQAPRSAENRGGGNDWMSAGRPPEFTLKTTKKAALAELRAKPKPLAPLALRFEDEPSFKNQSWEPLPAVAAKKKEGLQLLKMPSVSSSLSMDVPPTPTEFGKTFEMQLMERPLTFPALSHFPSSLERPEKFKLEPLGVPPSSSESLSPDWKPSLAERREKGLKLEPLGVARSPSESLSPGWKPSLAERHGNGIESEQLQPLSVPSSPGSVPASPGFKPSLAERRAEKRGRAMSLKPMAPLARPLTPEPKPGLLMPPKSAVERYGPKSLTAGRFPTGLTPTKKSMAFMATTPTREQGSSSLLSLLPASPTKSPSKSSSKSPDKKSN